MAPETILDPDLMQGIAARVQATMRQQGLLQLQSQVGTGECRKLALCTSGCVGQRSPSQLQAEHEGLEYTISPEFVSGT